MVWKEALKYSDGSVLCLSGCLKQNRFSPLSDVKSVVMKSASSSASLQGLLQIEKVAPAFEWLLWDTLSSKQEKSVTAHYKRECVYASGLFMGRERKASRDEYGKFLTLGSSCLMLLKEKNLRFMVIEVVCNWSHTAICQSLELRISAGISGQLLKSFVC